MQGTIMTAFYNSQDVEIMKISAKAHHKSRLKELIDYLRLSGFQKIGIANCIGVQPYADRLAQLLCEAGFDVAAVNCKESGLKGQDICSELSGPSCDPVAQAEFLNKEKTDFNIDVGLCLGHGLLFRKHSAAETTTFLVKDFATGHKSVENLL